jgi:hypothetical protein
MPIGILPIVGMMAGIARIFRKIRQAGRLGIGSRESAFAKASTFAEATVDRTVDKTADKWGMGE